MGKAPVGRLVPRGLHSATTNPDVIHRWWRSCPQANVGVRLDSLLVVDIDDERGMAEALKLGLPRGVTIIKTARGYHLYFQRPSGLSGAWRIKLVSLGAEVKSGPGHYTVAQHSLHRSGVLYSLHQTGDFPPPPPPAWAMCPPEADRTSTLPAHGPIPEGVRNDTLTRIAGSLRRYGCDEATIRAALSVVNAQRCSPPLPDAEVARIAASIGRRPTGPNGEAAVQPQTAATPHRASATKETPTQALVRLAAQVELCVDREGTAWAIIPAAGRREVWPVRSRRFHAWLAVQYLQEAGRAPGETALQDALGTIEAQALLGGRVEKVYTRVAEHEGKIYVDLGDPEWRAVEIDASGWRVVQDHPVLFTRPSGMQPLPVPQPGGDLRELRRFVNLPDEDSFVLVASWLVGALRARGPHPVLVVGGEPGSGKSTLCRILRSLVDPHVALLRRPPKEERDLFVAAANNWVLAYDNVSGLSLWQSDALCSIATGGGYSARKLYSNREEAVLTAQRPIIINGIDELTNRGDLRDRSLRVMLPRLQEAEYRDEATLWAEFEEARPRLLGALLTAVSEALRAWPTTHLLHAPRMVDFARWVVAAEGALPWESGAFLLAYQGLRESVAAEALEDSQLAQAIVGLVEQEGPFVGTAQELLEKLAARVSESTIRSRTWPQSPRALAGRLRLLAPDLRTAGLGVVFGTEGRGRNKRRIVQIVRTDGSVGPEAVVRLSSVGEGGDGGEAPETLLEEKEPSSPTGEFPTAEQGLARFGQSLETGEAAQEPGQFEASDSGEEGVQVSSAIGDIWEDDPPSDDEEWTWDVSGTRLPRRGVPPGFGAACRPRPVPPDVAAEVQRIEDEALALGWSKEDLWQNAGWVSDLGLAAVLWPGDRVEEVTAEYIAIRRRDGNRTRLYRRPARDPGDRGPS